MSQKKEGIWLYEPIMKSLEKKFKDEFGNCYLETTHEGKFSEKLLDAIPSGYGITLFFMGRRKAPDIVGFVGAEEAIESDMAVIIGDKKAERHLVRWREFIVAEIKNRKISLKDVCQTRNYALIFRAKYAFLMSPETIPDHIKRLSRTTNLLSIEYDWVLPTVKKQSNVRIAQFDILPRDNGEKTFTILDSSWFPDNLFKP